MEGAKIYNLGLSLLIRLSLFVKYLSFLGGETQRPYLITHSRVASAIKSIPPFHMNPDWKMVTGKTFTFLF